MAIKKMEMLNMVGHMDKVDEITRRLILSSTIHLVNAMTEIQQNNFPILQAQKDVEAVIDYNYIKQYTSTKELARTEERIRDLSQIFEVKNRALYSSLEGNYDFREDIRTVEKIYEMVEERHQNFKRLDKQLKELDDLEEYLSYMKHLSFNLTDAMNMQYIKVRFGKLSRHNMDKIKKNYENLSAIIIKLNSDTENVSVLVLVPENVEIEVDRVLKSLHFDEFFTGFKFEGTPFEWLKSTELTRQEINTEIGRLRDELSDLKSKYEADINVYYSRLMLEYKIEEFKSYMACTHEFFYFTGWVPSEKKKEVLKSIEAYEERVIIVFKEVGETGEGYDPPPTYMKNNRLLKPFESILRMYGVPAYNEIDPTPFMGISYMLLFGAMFGDIGQGSVLFLAGLFLSKRMKRPNLGGVFSSLGISSIIFGFLYGSIFGFEDLIKGTVVKPIKPMENINLMLIAAIVFGVILLSIGFMYNIANSYRKRDIEKGFLSNNGLAGMLFYWMLLYYVLTKVTGGSTIIPGGIILLILIFLMGLTLFKEPLSNLIMGVRPLYHESVADYYIDGSFGIVETLLSLFSNTLSFIRVGAFAINHVGLFIAFETLSHMMSNKVESVLVIVLGNIVIIGLEGLIVFIQGLRLEYYELFSKYYDGSGYEYSPCCIRTFRENYRRGSIKVNINENIKSKSI